MEKINNNLAKKIKKRIKNSKRPLIIVISGVNGVGKTTLAFHLSSILEIKQRVGLGSIVKTLIAIRPNNKNFFKMNNYFSPLSKTDLQKQSLLISKVVNLIIRKYNAGGVSCIIEGVQLLTRYLDNQIIQFHLTVNDSKKYRKQLKNSDTRKPRNVSNREFINLLGVNEILADEMNLPSVHLLYNSQSLVAIINQMLEDIAINLNIK